MKRPILSIMVSFCVLVSFAQPITVSGVTGTSPNTFLNTYFAGEGVHLDTCKFNWSIGNINCPNVGLFSNTNPSFPFSSGILLATGNISMAPGPNDASGETAQTSCNQNITIDPNLQALLPSNQQVMTTSVLEFYFCSGRNLNNNNVSFNYIFASEEYPEYVCADVNDVFGFFLTGPAPPYCTSNTTRNIAFIPGSNLPVSINTVNPGSVGSAGSADNCSPANGGSLNYSQFYRSSPSGNSSAIQFDGYTSRSENGQDVGMTAEAMLCPCAEYKMKISIANVTDRLYDSGVFLEQGSFRMPKMLTVKDSIASSSNSDTLIKNCTNTDITIHYGEELEDPLNIILIFSDESTANEGDFLLQHFRNGYDNTNPDNIVDIHNGDTIYFPEGSSLLELRLGVAETAQFAPNEVKTVKLVFKSILCPHFRYFDGHFEEKAQYDTIEYLLIDNNRFTLVSEDSDRDSIFYCDRCTHVEVPITGGTEPLRYNWSPAGLLNTPNARESNCNITENTTFKIVVSDRWGCLVDSCYHTILVTSTPELEGHYHITPNVICVPEEVEFRSTATPASTHIWTISSNNMPDTTIYGANTSYTFTEPGHYSIFYKAYEAEECAASINLPNYINAGLQPTASFHFDPAEAEVGDTVFFTNESNGLNVHYNWGFGDGGNSTEENPIHVYYSENNYNVLLTVSDDAGCEDTYTLPVPVVDNHVMYVPNSFTPNKDMKNDVFKPVVACIDKNRYYFVIYDRSGSIVFATNDPDTGWDGTIKGKECPVGVYTYFISYYRYNNLKQELIKTGTINLIR